MNNGLKRCINCGRKIPAENDFCKYCGANQFINSTISNTPDNGYHYKIITKSSSSYNPIKAISEANQRAKIAEDEVKNTNLLKQVQVQNRKKQVLKHAKLAKHKVSKMNTKSLKSESKTQRIQQQNNHAHHKQQKLQEQTLPKDIKQHRLRLLVWTYFMPIIVFIIFTGISSNINNLIVTTGIDIVSIIAIVIAYSIKKWYKKGSITSIVWNAIWILVALMFLAR